MNRQNSATSMHHNDSPRRGGFTLNELLVVIAIAVLVMALAVPAFNVITNSRSIDSAENQISAFVAGTRAEAIGLQEPRGVLFFSDPDTGRTTLVQVRYDPLYPAPTIDSISGRDEMVLPNGVGWQAVPEGTGAAQNYPWTSYGVVMFDRNGALQIDDFRIRLGSYLQVRIDPSKDSLRNRTGGIVTYPVNGRSTIGFTLFDKVVYDGLPSTSQATWLPENASPYLINRYNGTLLKGQ